MNTAAFSRRHARPSLAPERRPPAPIRRGTVTWGGTITGHIAKGQIITDSLGATAVVTGSSKPLRGLGRADLGSDDGADAGLHRREQGQPIPSTRSLARSSTPELPIPGSGAPPMSACGPCREPATTRSPPLSTVDKAILKTNSHWPSYTFDADWKNGSTEIRGAAQRDGPVDPHRQRINGSRVLYPRPGAVGTDRQLPAGLIGSISPVVSASRQTSR